MPDPHPAVNAAPHFWELLRGASDWLELSVNILCADDNEWIGDLYQNILAKIGHQVRSVMDGQAAWDLLAADLSAFDMVILDYQMPGLTGLEIVRRLSRDGYPGRIVVQSGFLTPEIEQALAAYKVDRIIYKPIGLPTIINVVSELPPLTRR